VNGRPRQGCQRLEREDAPWEEHAHARARRPRGRRHEVLRPPRSAEAVSDVVKRPVPRSCRTEPKTPWGFPAAKAASASREQTRCGYTEFVWVAEIGRTHRASFPPGGCKVSWRAKGASQEEVRSTV